MKIYKLKYCSGYKPKPHYLIQISKSEKWIGVRIAFYGDKKSWQDNWKNDLLSGIEKDWIDSKNHFFQNFKKHKLQGIEITFK